MNHTGTTRNTNHAGQQGCGKEHRQPGRETFIDKSLQEQENHQDLDSRHIEKLVPNNQGFNSPFPTWNYLGNLCPKNQKLSNHWRSIWST